jgi:dTDP-4-amino-4,6-dideoxygalactose transaminase
MSEEFLPFSRPTITKEAIDDVVACLKSGWIATGPRVKQFEEMLQNYFDAPHVLAVTSGTAGLHLALLGLDLKPGDEVITSSLTFVADLNTIVLAGAKPVLVDIDNSYNMDVNQVADAITPRTRAIIPVHFTGLSVDLDPIYELANKHNLRVIEDACQAIGSSYKNKLIGSFGDTQIFSFHPNKNITTGEGGCIVTRDPALAKKMSVLRFHGIDRDAFNRFTKQGSQHYDVIAPGLKYNMLDLQGVLGIHQLPELDNYIKRRTELADRYNDLLKNWPEWTLPHTPHYLHKHSWHLYTPLINPEVAGIDRDTFLQVMKDHNIGVGLHYDCVHLYSYYRENFGFKPGDFPKAENTCPRIMSLPLFPLMTDADQDRVITAMKKIFKRN